MGSVVNTKVGDMEENTRWWKNQEYEERSDGIFPGCGGEEYIFRSI